MGHSVIAVSFVYEECLIHGVVSAQLRHNEFFLRHFNSAVRLLRATKDQHPVLIRCLLFVCIETIQRNHEQASLHAKHGVRIFQALKTKNSWVHDTLGTVLFSADKTRSSWQARYFWIADHRESTIITVQANNSCAAVLGRHGTLPGYHVQRNPGKDEVVCPKVMLRAFSALPSIVRRCTARYRWLQ